MNHIALRACRGVLQMTVADAAEHIGHCEPRTWRYFEAGDRAIPAAVTLRMRTVLERRACVYNQLSQLAAEHNRKGRGLYVAPLVKVLDPLELAVQYAAQAELCAQGKILPF